MSLSLSCDVQTSCMLAPGTLWPSWYNTEKMVPPVFDLCEHGADNPDTIRFYKYGLIENTPGDVLTQANVVATASISYKRLLFHDKWSNTPRPTHPHPGVHINLKGLQDQWTGMSVYALKPVVCASAGQLTTVPHLLCHRNATTVRTNESQRHTNPREASWSSSSPGTRIWIHLFGLEVHPTLLYLLLVCVSVWVKLCVGWCHTCKMGFEIVSNISYLHTQNWCAVRTSTGSLQYPHPRNGKLVILLFICKSYL